MSRFTYREQELFHFGCGIPMNLARYLSLFVVLVSLSRSADWDIQPSGISGSGRPTSVVFGNDRFVMATRPGTNQVLQHAIAWSSDGRDWWPADYSFSGTVRIVCFDSVFYAIAPHQVHRSSNGKDWELVTSSSLLPSIANVVAGENAIVASSSNLNFPNVEYSTDGENWSLVELSRPSPDHTAFGPDLAFGGGYFWHSYRISDVPWRTKLVRSADGKIWEPLNPPWEPNSTNRLAYGNGRLLIESGSQLAVSTDHGDTFEVGPAPAAATHNISFAGQRFFSSSTLAWSVDGLDWRDPQSWDRQRAFNSVAYGNGRYVAAGGYVGYPNPGTDLIAVWETEAAPEIPREPSDKTGVLGRSVTFGVRSYSPPEGPKYQWFHNGEAIPGATTSKLLLEDLSETDAGHYHYIAMDNGLTVSSEIASLEIVGAEFAGRLTNLSVRAQSGAGDSAFIVGFVLGGEGESEPASLLVRGAGPALSDFGVNDVLSDPKLVIYPPDDAEPISYDDWGGSDLLKTTFDRLGAFTFTQDESGDAAALLNGQQPGPYTVHATGPAGERGTMLTEIYDASEGVSPARARLINLSCRTALPPWTGELNVGFVIAGETPLRVLLRSIGWNLERFGINNFHMHPEFDLYVHENGRSRHIELVRDSWSADPSTAARVGAFPLVAGNSILDPVLERELDPGVYSMIVRNRYSRDQVVLVEIYEVP